MKRIATLHSPDDTYNFTVGMPLVMTDAGDVRPATRGERVRGAIFGWWLRWTRWWRPRTVCSAIDRDEGRITLDTERWSWRRWRWDRA